MHIKNRGNILGITKEKQNALYVDEIMTKSHRPNNYKDKILMSSFLVFIRVHRLEIQSVMLVFPPSFLNYCPSTFSPVQHHHPPPFPVWISTGLVCDGGGGEIGVCGEHIQELYCTVCIWPDSEPTKRLYHPKQKPRKGGGLRQINACRQVPLLVNY